MWRYRTSLLLFLSIFHIALHNVALAAELKTVDLGYATYQSDVSFLPGVTSFMGIRYAAPPTGQRRWRAPQDPASVPGIQNATTPPVACLSAFLPGAQGTSLTNPFRGLSQSHRKRQLQQRDDIGVTNEDCLFLNVHVPTQTPSKLLPVIVYIHGGGYDAGNATLYPGEDFVIASNYNIVTVNIQYRLGVFGFLAGKKVAQGGALNAGLLDQNFALQWVQKHITTFGGDPTKVTIWGQSAGAGSMIQHIVAHGGNTNPPLFRAAMMNSPWLPPQYRFDDPIPESIFSRVISHVGCSSTSDTMACLRNAPSQALLDADSEIGLSGFLGTYSVLPVIDGSFIIERPTVTLARGRVNGQATLVSTQTNEGGLFVPANVLISNNVTLEQWTTQMFPRFNSLDIQQTLNLYRSLARTVPEQAALIMGESLFICPGFYTAKAFGQKGFKAEFAIPPALHIDDLPYEFHTLVGVPRNFDNPVFLKAWQQSFLAVALSLSPNNHFDSGNITPNWPGFVNNRSSMLFNRTTADTPLVKVVNQDRGQASRCDFWLSKADKNSQ